jgi:hypothetical protein
MITLKQRVMDYLEAQRSYYGDEEVDDSLEILMNQNETLSNMRALSRVFVLRLIDDNILFDAIERARENE